MAIALQWLISNSDRSLKYDFAMHRPQRFTQKIDAAQKVSGFGGKLAADANRLFVTKPIPSFQHLINQEDIKKYRCESHTRYRKHLRKIKLIKTKSGISSYP